MNIDFKCYTNIFLKIDGCGSQKPDLTVLQITDLKMDKFQCTMTKIVYRKFLEICCKPMSTRNRKSYNSLFHKFKHVFLWNGITYRIVRHPTSATPVDGRCLGCVQDRSGWGAFKIVAACTILNAVLASKV